MFNDDANNTIIIFNPGTRGNFVKNCLTFTKNTADSSYKNSPYKKRLEICLENVVSNPLITDKPPYGPGHAFDETHSKHESDYAENYIHSGHLSSIEKVYKLNLNNIKHIVITIDEETLFKFMVKFIKTKPFTEDISKYLESNRSYWDTYTKSKDWYELPYNDILNKDKFVEHCVSISNDDIYVDMISEYYDLYHRITIEENPR